MSTPIVPKFNAVSTQTVALLSTTQIAAFAVGEIATNIEGGELWLKGRAGNNSLIRLNPVKSISGTAALTPDASGNVSITPTNIGAVSTTQLTTLATPSGVPQLTTSGLVSLAQLSNLGTAQIGAALTTGAVANLVPQLDGAGHIQLSQISGLTTSQIADLTTAATAGKIPQLTTNGLISLAQLGNIGTANIGALTTGAVANLIPQLDSTGHLNPAQLQNITTTQISALTTGAVASLIPQLDSTGHIALAQLTGLTTSQIQPALTTSGGSALQAGLIPVLDSGGKLNAAIMPSSVVGGMTYVGTWDPTTPANTAPSTTPTKGQYWVVSVTGSSTISTNGGTGTVGPTVTTWLVGDIIVWNGSDWDRIHAASNEIISINSKTPTNGAVTLVPSDIGAVSTTQLTTLATPSGVPQLTTSGLMPLVQLSGLGTAQIGAALATAAVAGLVPQLTGAGAIPLSQIQALTTTQLSCLTTAQSAGLVPQLNASGQLSTSQIAIGTTSQIGILKAAQAGSFTIPVAVAPDGTLTIDPTQLTGGTY